MAVTHTELYRRFDGELRRRPLRFVPIFLADLESATRRKLPLILFFAPPAITAIVYSFLVYARFTAEAEVPGAGLDPAQMLALAMAKKMVAVNRQIAAAASVSRAFALLIVAWFGAGLIAEDRRVNAHLLYFSRPLTRLDYYLGHFCTVAFFGLCAVLVPGLVICVVATFSSPDFAFLREEWDVIAATVGYALLYTASLGAFVLAVSSLVRRKVLALALVFGLVIGSQAVGGVLSALLRDRDWQMVGLWANYERLGGWMLGARRGPDWDPLYSLAILAALGALSALVAALRIRRMEVVA